MVKEEELSEQKNYGIDDALASLFQRLNDDGPEYDGPEYDGADCDDLREGLGSIGSLWLSQCDDGTLKFIVKMVECIINVHLCNDEDCPCIDVVARMTHEELKIIEQKINEKGGV